MKKFWVGVEPDYTEKYYCVHKFKSYVFRESQSRYLFCKDKFENLTGLKLKPGEIVQVELKVIKKG